MPYQVNDSQIMPGNTKFESGTRTGTSGFQIEGSDIFTLYETVASGTSSGVDTGFQDGGNDIDNLLAEYNSVSIDFSTFNTSYIVTATRPTPGSCRANWGLETDGDVFRRINLTDNANGALTDIDDWINPKTRANASDFQYRVGDETGSISTLSGVVPPSGAITSQSWNNLTGTIEYFVSGINVSSTGSFKIQLRHPGSNTESSICTVTITADGSGS